ncbi:MAG: alpha/beta fold hydrolase [Actinomycetota bacterium]
MPALRDHLADEEVPMPAKVLTTAQLDAITGPQGPPARGRLIGELATALQPARLAIQTPRLLAAPRGSGRTAMLLPGWKAPESSMWPIGSFLDRLGHRTTGWGLGTNQGTVEAFRDQLVERVPTLVERSGRPINLVGWSLGGVVAREVARVLPEQIHRVVTFGTPAVGGPTYTIGAASFGEEESTRIRELQEEMDVAEPIRVPITAIFTRRDAAVDWRACIDRASTDVTMVEVTSTHIGLGLDPDVWLTAARALAESSDNKTS